MEGLNGGVWGSDGDKAFSYLAYPSFPDCQMMVEEVEVSYLLWFLTLPGS